MTNRVLVLFTPALPPKGVAGYETIIAPRALEGDVRAPGVQFEALEDLVDPGSIQEAAATLGELARATDGDGKRVSQSVMYQGYELWWIHYDDLMYRHCLPYTQYRRLLEHLKEFSSITLERPPVAGLFSLFLEAYGCRYKIRGPHRRKFPPFGIWLQVVLSLLSLPFLMLKRPGLMVYTGDLFDPPRDHSFRMRFIYEELYRRELSFVEFIRSMEPARTVLAHAIVRRRPVIYSYAIKVVTAWVASLFGEDEVGPAPQEPERAFTYRLACYYLHNVRGTRWSIKAMHLLLRGIGVRAALIPAGGSRTFHELLGCKLAGIPSVGILHGASSKSYVVYDFMPEFSGKKMLSVDKYGLWSQWWRDYYIKNSRAYTPEQLHVSGPMRPLFRTGTPRTKPPAVSASGPLKVLFMSEQLAAPAEVLPFLEVLLDRKDMDLFFKFRSYHDGFEEWLKANRPDILEKIDSSKVMRGAMADAVARCDVVVGSHTTGVLEALLQMRPMVFFNTRKWGDYFDLESYNASYGIFAKDPAQLVEFVLQSKDAPPETLKKLQEMFFGDPYKNGSVWVVEQVEKFL